MMKELIIIGASGLGREVAWIVERINAHKQTWNLLGFLDDNLELEEKKINGYPWLGVVDSASDYPDAWYMCAVGSSRIRRSIINKIGDVKYATLIDPSVLLSDTVSVGEGTVIGAYSVLGVNSFIGKHVLIRVDDMIGHDAVLNDFVTIYPSVNVSGNVEIGECTEIGVGSQIIQSKKVGHDTIVGAGSVVVKDIPSECTAVGSPAKPIKYHNQPTL